MATARILAKFWLKNFLASEPKWESSGLKMWRMKKDMLKGKHLRLFFMCGISMARQGVKMRIMKLSERSVVGKRRKKIAGAPPRGEGGDSQ